MSDDEPRAPVGGEEEEDEILADTWELEASEKDELAEYLLSLEDIEDLVIEMKNNSELAVDLAYSSLLYESEDIAEEVAEIEEIIDTLHRRLQRSALTSLRRGDISIDHTLALLRLGSATEAISDAALDIADVVLRDLELHPIVAAMIRDSDVVITRGRVQEESFLAGQTLGHTSLESETGMRAIAIKRERLWIYGPDAETRLEPGDVVVARGPPEGEDTFKQALAGDIGSWD